MQTLKITFCKMAIEFPEESCIWKNSGFLTAQELGRQLGRHRATVVDYVRQGKVVGTKEGYFWKTDPSRGEIWDGRSIHKEDPLLMQHDLTDKSCIICGSKIDRTADHFCSKVCRGEHSSIVVHEREMQVEHPGWVDPQRSFPPYLMFDFQDWLAQDNVGFLTKTYATLNLGSIELSLGEKLRPKEQAMHDTLVHYNKEDIIPWQFFGDENHWQTFTSLKNKACFPTTLFGNPEIGYGIGIKDLKIDLFGMMVLRQLYQKRNTKSGWTIATMTENLYGCYKTK